MTTKHVRVWLLLVKVITEREDNTIELTVGSEALIQCFIPVTDLGLAIRECDRLLSRKGYRRIELMKEVPFDPGEEYPDAPDFVIADVELARESGPHTGTFFFSRDTASFQYPTEPTADSDDAYIKVYEHRRPGWFTRFVRRLIKWLR